MFEFDIISDNSTEIQKRFEQGPVLCMLLNPKIKFQVLDGLKRKKYIVESENGIAMVGGVSRVPIVETLTPEQIKVWNGSDTLEEKSVLEHLVDDVSNPYIVLGDFLTRQQIDGLRSIFKITKNKYLGKFRFCIACIYYDYNKGEINGNA